ncbi:MAG: hypothetical protein SVS85_02735 [Candidatus Nanohaloarchaea archaeon]|nr:hypothetical protein [Candidatus Nanohaloarchaea archaeon]
MDEISEDEIGFLGHRLLEKHQTAPLRERMEEFVEDHSEASGFRQLREKAADGKPLSEIVLEDREGRL